MAKTFYVAANAPTSVFGARQFKDSKDTFKFDLSAWAEENSTVSSATWTVEAGTATVSGESLATNVASALVSFTGTGGALIKVVCDTGTEQRVVWLDAHVTDPETVTLDYGLTDR